MKKIIREVDQKRGIMQITTSDERWYLKPGKDAQTGLPIYKPVPSVTWVAGYYPKGIQFYKWLADQGWDEAQAIKVAAGDKGSAVHLAIEMILSGMEFRIDTKVQDKSRSTEQETYERELTYEELLCVASFLEWKRRLDEAGTPLTVLATEITIFSEIHGYAGTVDLICKIGDQPYIVDFKTSKSVWTEYMLQVSAYRRALENGENPIEDKDGKLVDLSGLKTAILQVGYTGNQSGFKFTEVDDHFDLFLTAQKIWRNELPVKDQYPGFTQKEFPLVLSPGSTVEISSSAEPQPSMIDMVGEQSALPVGTKRGKKHGKG